MNRRRLFLLLIFPLFAVSLLVAQEESAAPEAQQAPFKSHVRMVLVDVVVTDSKHEPVIGLTKDKFQVLEDGKPQFLASFEEHAGIPDVPALSRMAHLPQNVFSNVPLAKAGETANILLLDSLNTGIEDQSYVHAQMIRYIKDIRPGTKMGIFTLSDRLRFVQGFTEDPALLMAAVNGRNGAGSPERSVLLQTSSEENAKQQGVGQIQAMASETGDPAMRAAADALSRFLKENAASQTSARVNLTLEAINQLVMYLQAIPGRKNVIWFTGSFPLNTLSNDPDMLRDYGPQVAKTANLLAAARIAIYPLGVGAMGLTPNSLYDAGTPSPAGGVAAATAVQTMTQAQVQSYDQDSTERAQNSASLEELANNTGGQFFLNTNGFNDVLDHVLKTGTHYYTLTYSPTNQNMDGQVRHIQIKLSDGKYLLAYRRGYYATNDFMGPVSATKTTQNRDPLRPLMEHGTPDSTEILYMMKVVPLPRPAGTLELGSASGSKRAGDNDKLKGAVTRYRVTFTVLPDRLALETSADGTHHGNVEVSLLAYDRDGTPVNWIVRLLQLAVPRERYEQAEVNGVGFNLEIDVPQSGLYLRSGIYDWGSNRAGTLEIPIAAVAASAAAAGNMFDRFMASPDTNSAVLSLASGPPQTNKSQPSDMSRYCSTLAGTGEHSSALATVCAFALSVPKKLPDIVCERKTQRYWKTYGNETLYEKAAKDDSGYVSHSDVITAQVTYRDGRENDENLRVDGKPADAAVPWSSGAWSIGEFALNLNTIFLPSSRPEFRYRKEEKLHSVPAFVFEFHVLAENNKLYHLRSGDKEWFPEYSGKLWLDKTDFRLLRLERETADMPGQPIGRMKTATDYSLVALGDGTSIVLPVHAEVLICTLANDALFNSCARNVVSFTKWQKFRATTNIILNPN